MARINDDIVVALDIGSTKICCLIAAATDDNTLEIIGASHHKALGIKGGHVIDMNAAEEAIAITLQAAEEEANIRVERAMITCAGGRPYTELVSSEQELHNNEIIENDLRKLLGNAHPQHLPTDYDVLHKLPVRYILDGSSDITDPKGMYGENLQADTLILGASSNTMRTLATCIKRCHLDVEAFVPTGLAAGFGCLLDEERDLGVAVIDMGSHVSSIGIFKSGKIHYVGMVPIGGQHISLDITQGLATSLTDAERLKTLHGAAISPMREDREMLEVNTLGDQDQQHSTLIPRSALLRIIQPRVEETLELIKKRLEDSGHFTDLRLVVLTGGASQLPGIREAAGNILGLKIRQGKPLGVVGLPKDFISSTFTACVGTLLFSRMPKLWVPSFDQKRNRKKKTGLLAGGLRWIKDNF